MSKNKDEGVFRKDIMIGTIINYCTNDYRFLSACVEEAKQFSRQIIIPVCDHFFNGTKENKALLQHSYRACPECTFIEYAFSKAPYGLYPQIKPGDPDWIHYWHSTSRYIGSHFLAPEIEYILFLDVDEIADRLRFKEWLETFPYRDYEAIRFTHYFYFRDSSFRAKKWMRNPLMIRRDALDKELFLDVLERRGNFLSIQGDKIEDVGGNDGKPLFHHYSWVKPKEEMLKKVETWGHHRDKNWKPLIDLELQESFSLQDKFWGLAYEKVTPLFDPLTVLIPQGEASQERFSHVIQIDRDTLFREQISRML